MEGMLAFELGGASGENAMAVISEGLQSTKRHRWTAKLVRSDDAVKSMAIQIFFDANSRQRFCSKKGTGYFNFMLFEVN